MIHLYRVLTNFLYPFLIILIYIRKFIKKEHHSRFKEKIFRRNFNINKNPKLRLIWFHAASIGELKSILPLIKHLNKNEKKIEILITTITISLFGKRIQIIHMLGMTQINNNGIYNM